MSFKSSLLLRLGYSVRLELDRSICWELSSISLVGGHHYCFNYDVVDWACCYSHGRGATLTPHSTWSIRQHFLLVFEAIRSFALDQVGLMNLDPFRLNGRVMKICMIQIYVPHKRRQNNEARNGC